MRLIWFAVGCGGSALQVSPAALDFGEVDLQQDPPSEGLNALDLVLSNTGNKALDLQVVGVDPVRFRLSAQLVADDPPTLAALPGSQDWVVRLGVIGYVPGEWDTEVTGQFVIREVGAAEGVSVPWSYTPIRDFNPDSGR